MGGTVAPTNSLPMAPRTGPVVAVPLLRGERPEAQTLIDALAEIWVNGTTLDWTELFKDSTATASVAPHIRLPTRALLALALTGLWGHDRRRSGLRGSPLLGAVVALADDGGWVFTGRLSLETHPWLADHAVMGAVLLPGTAFLELALHAGRELEHPVVSELTLETPLVLPEQVARADPGFDQEPDEPENAHCRFTPRGGSSGDGGLPDEAWDASRQWHARCGRRFDARRATIDGRAAVARERAALWPQSTGHLGVRRWWRSMVIMRLWLRSGLEYGPAFQGLRGAWRRGEEVFAEVALAGDRLAQADSFGLHPALLDAALHASGFGLDDTADGEGERSAVRLPFSWSGVRCYASGASSLRVCLARPVTMECLCWPSMSGRARRLGRLAGLACALRGAARCGPRCPWRFAVQHGLDWCCLLAQAAPMNLVLLGVEGSALGGSLAEAGMRLRCMPTQSLCESLDEAGGGADRGVGPGVVLVDCTLGRRRGLCGRGASRCPSSTRVGAELALGGAFL